MTLKKFLDKVSAKKDKGSKPPQREEEEPLQLFDFSSSLTAERKTKPIESKGSSFLDRLLESFHNSDNEVFIEEPRSKIESHRNDIEEAIYETERLDKELRNLLRNIDLDY